MNKLKSLEAYYEKVSQKRMSPKYGRDAGLASLLPLGCLGLHARPLTQGRYSGVLSANGMAEMAVRVRGKELAAFAFFV